MSHILTEEQLRSEIQQGSLIDEGDVNCAEGIKYDFRLSENILKSSFGGPINLLELPAIERSRVAVDPGEVVFVLTKERIRLPDDVMITLSPKRKLSHEGVQILGGLCVDPLYSGHLLIGLYNFSSVPFLLKPGRKLIAGVFHRLSDVEKMDFVAPETVINGFPDELVLLIKNYQPVGTKDLMQKVEALTDELGLVKTLLDDDKKWRDKFKGYLEEHNKQIGDLLDGLKKEKENRESSISNLSEKINDQSISYRTFVSKANFIGALSLIAIGGLIGALFSKLLS